MLEDDKLDPPLGHDGEALPVLCVQAPLAGAMALTTAWAEPCPNGTRGLAGQRHLPARKSVHAQLRHALEVIAFAVVVTLICIALPVQAHGVDCAGRTGIDLARCERHQAMAGQCGPIKGEAHFVCDREFLLANPLQCKALAGDDVKRCQAEVRAFKTCEPQAGREFMRCVRDEVKASPMGAP